jgi:hypothetical protein
LKVDPEAHCHYLPGWQTIDQTEEHARDLAFTDEEAVTFRLCLVDEPKGVESEEVEIPKVASVEALARTWHLILDECLKRWGNSPGSSLG